MTTRSARVGEARESSHSVVPRLEPNRSRKHWCSPVVAISVAPVGTGLWVRATGVSGFERKAFRGQPGEAATVALFQRLLRPGMTVFFDVAEMSVTTSPLAARRVGDGGRVHAFEATPAVAERLNENIRLNRLANVSGEACRCLRSGWRGRVSTSGG